MGRIRVKAIRYDFEVSFFGNEIQLISNLRLTRSEHFYFKIKVLLHFLEMK